MEGSKNSRELTRTPGQSLADVSAELARFKDSVTEQIQGSMDANHPGLASRIQSLEAAVADLNEHNFAAIETRLALLENNAIQDGKAEFARMGDRVSSLSRLSWTIGSSVALAIVSALIGLVLKK